MLWNKRKAKEAPTEPVKAPVAPERTERVEMPGTSRNIPPEPPKAPRLAAAIINEFMAEEWHECINKELYEVIKGKEEELTVALLLAIYGELRLIRDAVQK